MEILCQENHILIFNWDNTDSSNWLKCSDLYGTYLMSCFLWIQQIHIKGDLFYWCCLKFKDFFLLSKGIWEFCRLWVSKKFVSLLVSQLPKKRAGWHPTVLAHKKPTWPAHTPDCLCLLQKVWQGAQDSFPSAGPLHYPHGAPTPHSQGSVEKSALDSTELCLSMSGHKTRPLMAQKETGILANEWEFMMLGTKACDEGHIIQHKTS